MWKHYIRSSTSCKWEIGRKNMWNKNRGGKICKPGIKYVFYKMFGKFL